MIRVTVELVSAIHPSRSRLLGTAIISNDGTGTVTRSDYNVALVNKHGRPYARTHVTGYPRKAVSVWNLVAFGLTNILRGVASERFHK